MFSSAMRTIGNDGLSARQMMMLIAYSMNDLSWDYYIKNEHELFARCNMGLFKWGERISITITGEHTSITVKQPALKVFNTEMMYKDMDMLEEYIGHNRKIYTAEELQESFENYSAEKKEKPTPTERIIISESIPVATITLIAVNVLYFIAFTMAAFTFHEKGAMAVFHFGGNIRLYTFGGEGWRLLTNCFMHFGIGHLFSNMIILFIIGRYLEPVTGPGMFVTAYLCTGIMGSLTSVLQSGSRISAGASGAVFGLYGVFLALLTTRMLSGEIKRILFQSIALFTAYGLLSGMSAGIDNAAHMGGLVSGFIFGYLIYAGQRSDKMNLVAGASVLIITGVTTISCLYFFHNDTIRYERMLKRMISYENDALSARTDMNTKSPGERLRDLSTVGRENWKMFIKTVDSAKNFRFGNNKFYAKQKDLLAIYGRDRNAENEIWIKSLETGNEMEAQKDSIRSVIYDKQEQLTTLRNNRD